MVGDLSAVQASGTLRFKPLWHTEQLHETVGGNYHYTVSRHVPALGGERNMK